MDADALLRPRRLYSRAEVLNRPSPVPAKAGAYGWYFDLPPGETPIADSHEWDGHRLLYVGIAPKKPPASGKPNARTVADRIREHYNLNAYGSTLRLSLGCLLGLELRRIASKKHPGDAKRMTFGRDGERQLNEWMSAHARVVWEACADAWDVEHDLLQRLALPLNLDANSHSSFHEHLSELRGKAKARARQLPPLSG